MHLALNLNVLNRRILLDKKALTGLIVEVKCRKQDQEKVKQKNNFALTHIKKIYKSEVIESQNVLNPTAYYGAVA